MLPSKWIGKPVAAFAAIIFLVAAAILIGTRDRDGATPPPDNSGASVPVETAPQPAQTDAPPPPPAPEPKAAQPPPARPKAEAEVGRNGHGPQTGGVVIGADTIEFRDAKENTLNSGDGQPVVDFDICLLKTKE